MKKALQISIAKTLFTVEEDAYAALDRYLAAVKAHFAATDGHDEIVADIETRIAEQLLESKEQVITLPTVESVTKQMGSVDDFDDAETTKRPLAEQVDQKKKLYRDADNGIIAGVCSGLAAFFGVNVLWLRIGFVVLSLFNLVGVIIYGILWLVLPEAKTASQKLEMVGTPVTLATLSETVNERIGELRSSRGRRVGRALVVPFRVLFQILRVFVGAVMVFASGLRS
jgi:phage shock protein PspC (stress-responsive transcriptional regulator)